MRLADAAAILGLEAVCDAEFDSLGLLSGDAPRMLAGLYDQRVVLRDVACLIRRSRDRLVRPGVPQTAAMRRARGST